MILKKIIALALAVVLSISSACAVSVYVDGSELDTDVPAQIVEGRTLVPVAPIFQALGASVSWDRESQTVTGVKENITVKIVIGSNTAYVNGAPVTLDVPAKIIDGRTMVPLAFVSQSLGASVHWNSEISSARIITKLYDVVRVIDGNTFVIDYEGTERQVRLIGVDVPSSKSEAGIAAEAFSKSYLENEKVELEFDVEKEDKYNRLLAYVYTEKGVMLNAKLLMAGYGSLSKSQTNIKYLDEFKNIVASKDKSLLSVQYENGAMKAPSVIFDSSARTSTLNSAILYDDGEIIEKKKIENYGENGDETWRYIGLKTKSGVINIFNPIGVSLSGKISSMTDKKYDDLKVGDFLRVKFVFVEYYKDENRPEGYYLETVKKYETVKEDSESNVTQSRTVYITKTGRHYHFNWNCNGGNYFKTTLSAAKSRGLTPCSKCAK